MQCRDVAETDYPLRVTCQLLEVERFEQVHRAIATTAAQDGANLGIDDCLEQVVASRLDGCTVRHHIINGVLLTTVLSLDRHKSPLLDGTHSTVDPLGQHCA